MNKERPRPADIVLCLCARLHECSRPRHASGKYNTTRLRMSVAEFRKKYLDKGPIGQIKPDFRDRIIEAGRDEGIVIGIGHRVVTVTHDDRVKISN